MIAHGATEASTPSDTRLTHAISDSWRFEGWRDVQREGVVVVTDKWVERLVILSKPQPYAPRSFFLPFLIVIGTSANLPSSDIEVLSAGLSALGGQWRPALTREITHLSSLSPAGEKYSTAMQIKSIKVVVPHWFDDCVRLGVRVPEGAYEWPDPAMLDNSGVALVGVESATSERKLLLKGKEKEGGMMGIAAKYTPELHAPSSRLINPATASVSRIVGCSATHGARVGCDCVNLRDDGELASGCVLLFGFSFDFLWCLSYGHRASGGITRLRIRV